MDTIIFGSGRVFIIDNGTPTECGVIKDVALEYSSTIKQLKGNKRFAIATAVSDEKLSGKIGSGVFNGKLLATIIGGTVSTGSKAVDSQSTTGASLTVVPPSSGTFVEDLGVKVAGVDLKKVASAPALGEYTCSGVGAYAFNAGQTGTKVTSFRYSVTTGNTLAIKNKVQSSPATFQLVLDEVYEGGRFGVKLFKVVIPKLSVGVKSEEFADTGIDFECSADANDDIGEIYF